MMAMYRQNIMEQTPQHARRRRPMRTPGSFQKTPVSGTTPSAYEEDSFVTDGGRLHSCCHIYATSGCLAGCIA